MSKKAKPKRLRSKKDRAMARRMRDSQWRFAERCAEFGTVWVCWWDKAGRHRGKDLPPDLFVHGLIDGMEMLEWLHSHPDWWVIGEWSDARYAAAVTITDAGREALRTRHLYDLEPVTGGLVEPGWIATPTPAASIQSEGT